MLRFVTCRRPGQSLQESIEKSKLFLFFEEKSIFQKLFRTIRGPQKHVLHLVWSVPAISTAIEITLCKNKNVWVFFCKKTKLETYFFGHPSLTWA